MLSWIKTKAKEYWRFSTDATVHDRQHQRDSSEIGAAPWEIGRPQPAFVSLAQSRQIRDPVLDIGCGTGENALYLASLGLDVNGVDSTRAAIETARDKARVREVRANFRVVDALDLACLGTTFETVIDSGLFHLFTDEERHRFLPSLAAVLRPGGTYFMLCFSIKKPVRDPGGFHRRRSMRRFTRDGPLITFTPPPLKQGFTTEVPKRGWLLSLG